MTEHNDRPAAGLQSPAEPLKTRKSSKLFRLGVSCLVLLMFTALLLAGGSFSKNTSTGEISISFPLTMADFNVEAVDAGYTSGEKYDENQLVVYAFTVNNDSDVDITYDMVFDISISEVIDGFKFILVDESNIDNNIDFNSSGQTEIDYSTEDNGNAFFQSMADAKTYVLVADYSGCDRAPASPTITVSGTITITVNQAKEAA